MIKIYIYDKVECMKHKEYSLLNLKFTFWNLNPLELFNEYI